MTRRPTAGGRAGGHGSVSRFGGQAGRRSPMRDTSPDRWRRWRVTRDKLARNRFDYMRAPVPAAAGAAGVAEQPGPDGIRHELVARIRREIAAGTYDTEEKWLAAEEELLRRIEERL